jgi:transposase
MATLVDELVPDQLWAMVEPLLPVPPRPPYGGRRRAIPDRNCFAAIVYMARTSTPWRLLPARELGCGSPSTCWRRLTEWANAGVFDQLHLEVLDRLGAQGRLDWSRTSIDTMSVRAKRGGPRWRKSGRSWQAREQAAPGLRGRWAAADRRSHRRQRRRYHHVRGVAGRRPADPDAVGAAARPACGGARGQGLRQRGQPGLAAAAWDPAADCPAWDRLVGAPWAASVEGRAGTVVAELLQAAAGSLGPGLGAVLRLRAAGLRARLLQPALESVPR